MRIKKTIHGDAALPVHDICADAGDSIRSG